MRLNFKFTKLFGTSYKSGNILFFQNGSGIFSPTGNQITIFNLLRDESRTISVNSHYNIQHQALSPCLPLLFAINTNGEGSLISLITGHVISVTKFRHPVNAVSFSHNGKFLAVAKNHCIMIFLAPKQFRTSNSLEIYRVLYGFDDTVTCLDWSCDSQVLLAGSNDMTARLFSINKSKKLVVYTLSGHKSPVLGAYTLQDSLDCFSVSADGELRLWNSDTSMIELKKSFENVDTNESDCSRMLYKLVKKHKFRTSNDKNIQHQIKSIAFNKKQNLLVSGLENGLMLLHQMPDFIILNEFRITPDPITTLAINRAGDWIALGSEEHGQLAVWEWRSQSCHFRAESHANEMTSLTYSPDGLTIVTSGRDGKVKVWHILTGRAMVTFSEHQAAVTQVVFPANKPKEILSCSLDGTVRAFDLTRYRNFRTMSVPTRTPQLASLGVDAFGELVAAGALDTFEAYVWSVRSGQLLTMLTGHTAPISAVQFNPGLEAFGSLEMATASWDCSLRTWSLDGEDGATSGGHGDAATASSLREVIDLPSDAICMAYRGDGKAMAVALLNATILFFDRDGRQTGSIEGQPDLGVTQVSSEDLVTPKRAARERRFLSMDYSVDGQYLLAGGTSKYVCLYSIPDQLLVKRFEITINMSLEGVQEAHDRRRFLSDYSAEAALAKQEGREAIPLPGVRSGDEHSRRWWRPDVNITSVRFAPTGESFAAATTEGVFVYALECAGSDGGIWGGLDSWMFDASALDEDCTPSYARQCLREGRIVAALDIALKLRSHGLTEEIIEGVPYNQINYLVRNLPLEQVVRFLLSFLSRQLEGRSRHVAFYVAWVDAVLLVHGLAMRRSINAIAHPRGLQLASLNAEEAEKLKLPGVLVERSEWQAFQASLVRLHSGLTRVRSHLTDRMETVDALWAYLSSLCNLIKPTDKINAIRSDHVQEIKILDSSTQPLEPIIEVGLMDMIQRSDSKIVDLDDSPTLTKKRNKKKAKYDDIMVKSSKTPVYI